VQVLDYPKLVARKDEMSDTARVNIALDAAEAQWKISRGTGVFTWVCVAAHGDVSELVDADEIAGGYGSEESLKNYLQELVYAEEDSKR